MYNFVMLHRTWAVLTIGVIRGFRQGRERIKAIFDEMMLDLTVEDVPVAWDESRREAAKTNTISPLDLIYGYMAIVRAKTVVLERMNSGTHTYRSVEELVAALDAELEYQKIAVREGITPFSKG